jgi:hypothetical protein
MERPSTDPLTKRDKWIARLGNVLYWTACALAFCWFVLSMLAVVPSPSGRWPSGEWGLGLGIGLVGGLIIWLIGRAIRYFLAGR